MAITKLIRHSNNIVNPTKTFFGFNFTFSSIEFVSAYNLRQRYLYYNKANSLHTFSSIWSLEYKFNDGKICCLPSYLKNYSQHDCLSSLLMVLSELKYFNQFQSPTSFFRINNFPTSSFLICTDWLPLKIPDKHTDYAHLKIDSLSFCLVLSKECLSYLKSQSTKLQDICSFHEVKNGLFFYLKINGEELTSEIITIFQSFISWKFPEEDRIQKVAPSLLWCAHDIKTWFHILNYLKIKPPVISNTFDTSIISWLFNADLHTQSLHNLYFNTKSTNFLSQSLKNKKTNSSDSPLITTSTDFQNIKAMEKVDLGPPELKDFLCEKYGRYGWGIYNFAKKKKTNNKKKGAIKKSNSNNLTSKELFDKTIIYSNINNSSFITNLSPISTFKKDSYVEFEPIFFDNQNNFEKRRKTKVLENIPEIDRIKFLQIRCIALSYLYSCLDMHLFNDKSLKKVWEIIERPLIYTLYLMEERGIYVDSSILKGSINQLPQAKSLLLEFEQLAEAQINPLSSKQLSELLYDKLGFTPITSTSPHSPPKKSTDNDSLYKLLQQTSNFEENIKEKRIRLVETLKTFRKVMKLISTYIDRLPTFINPVTQRIHCRFLQAGTSTGRLSCESPNLQQIPSKQPYSSLIKNSFLPKDIITKINKNDKIINNLYLTNNSNIEQTINTSIKWKYISFDYSQMELYLLAYLSHDPYLRQALNSSDTFITMASSLFKCKVEDVSKEMRTAAKITTYGIIYGQTDQGLAQSLHTTKSEAKELINKFFELFPYVKIYLDFQVHWAEKYGSTQTLIGRRRITPQNMNTRKRIAMNTPIQGFAADIIKFASNLIVNELNNQKLENPHNPLKAHLILQIHDELMFEAQEDHCSDLINIVKPIMENAWNKIIIAMESEYTYFLTYQKFLLDQEKLNGYIGHFIENKVFNSKFHMLKDENFENFFHGLQDSNKNSQFNKFIHNDNKQQDFVNLNTNYNFTATSNSNDPSIILSLNNFLPVKVSIGDSWKSN